jgi:hypothetical protein
MLQYFAVKRAFYKLSVRLFVDVEHREAEITVLYDHRIKSSRTVRFDQVATVELAEAFLSQHVGERGSLLETLEHQFRSEAA